MPVNQFGDPANNQIARLRDGQDSSIVRGYGSQMILLTRVDGNVPSTLEAGEITVYYVHLFSGVPTALV